MTRTPRRVMWFRRDLRLTDLPALAEAADDGAEVVPLFVADPRLIDPSVRSRYLARSLSALDQQLGGALLVRWGDPRQVVPAVAAEAGATSVHISADFAPYGRQRDEAVARALTADGRTLVPLGSPYAIAPGRVTKSDGTPYRVYTPFYRAWSAHGWRDPAGNSGDGVRWRALPGDKAASVAARVEAAAGPEPLDGLPAAGELAALARWRDFRTRGLADYNENRNRPDLSGTSGLSAHLRFGEIHPRTLLAELDDSNGAEAYRREIAFREFYADVLWHHPHSARASLDSRYDTAMPHDTGPHADAAFEAWCAGRTGYPFVDAGMRQLLAEGWIHNRVRMVVASFLVKDLHLPWWLGARWFMARLRDGDLASNAAGWQWTAGCGTDASPYHRIFNPTSQGQKFDPDGDYLRRYLPELRDLPGRAAHEPWLHPLLAPDYPERIVDHAVERLGALDRLRIMKVAAASGGRPVRS
ncbi:MAG: deoxyribodipyrimidine photo-lyase [Actinomycetota bacterium]|nr:deoxyribodipyrimidine photo-lyase [Actinomycetota bacterium]